MEKENNKKCPPVVVILGHVDHGKSSLIEKVKEIKITEKESGGITQHIGAYQIEHSFSSEGKERKEKITFLDTPGHEAFKAIRSRGAKVADIAILVVASEEGIKPQTKEAISYIKKTGIPLIVALNKIDKPEADPERVKRELAGEEILVESMGGNIPSVEVSARTGQGVPELLEMILLLSEMEDFRADLNCNPEGVVIESCMDCKRGCLATLLVKKGVLKRGDMIATPSTVGKVKVLEDFQGNSVKEAFPSMPCIVSGFQNVPKAGEKFKYFENLEKAKEFIAIEHKKEEEREVIDSSSGKILNLILKGDVEGSLEAIEGVLKNIPQEKVALRILKKETGNVSESDIKMARSSNAKIICFRVGVDPIAEKLALRDNIGILKFDVIYDLSQQIRNIMNSLLKPELKREDLAEIKVLAIFRTEKKRQIIGGKVIDGKVVPSLKIEVIRDGEIVGKGKMISLQKDKKETSSAKKGEDCGILYEGNEKVLEGDVLHMYKEEKTKEEI
jgi:translation initiation factor IF-2